MRCLQRHPSESVGTTAPPAIQSRWLKDNEKHRLAEVESVTTDDGRAGLVHIVVAKPNRVPVGVEISRSRRQPNPR